MGTADCKLPGGVGEATGPLGNTSGADWVRTNYSWYEYLVSIEGKMGHVIAKSIQKFLHLPNLEVIGLNAKTWHTFKNR